MNKTNKSNKTQQVIALLIAKDHTKKHDGFYMILKNLIINDLFALMGEDWTIAEVGKKKWHLNPLLNDLSFLLSGKHIESRHAKKILEDAWNTEPYAWDIGWYLCGAEHLTDTMILEEVEGDGLSVIVSKIIDANPKAKADIMNGKKQAIGFFVGRVMREAKGKADPNSIKEEIERYIALNAA